MNDILYCPICNSKLQNKKMNNHFLHSSSKLGNFVERKCIKGMNHFIIFFTDVDSKKIVFLKTSLDHTHSKLLEVNFHKSTSQIYCFKMGESKRIDIPKVLELDFPSMEKIKEKVNLLITFS